MVRTRTRGRIRKTVIQLSIAALTFASLGAVVVAAPSLFVPKMQVAQPALQALAGGPAFRLAKAGYGTSEDCVRVTSMTGPDGKQYPTRGMVCSGGDE